MTIEQRAKELYIHEHEDVCLGRDFYNEQSFVVGAKVGIHDQQKIDIDKAWELVKKKQLSAYTMVLEFLLMKICLQKVMIFFKKAMEE